MISGSDLITAVPAVLWYSQQRERYYP